MSFCMTVCTTWPSGVYLHRCAFWLSISTSPFLYCSDLVPFFPPFHILISLITVAASSIPELNVQFFLWSIIYYYSVHFLFCRTTLFPPLDLRSLLYDNRQFYFVVAFSHSPWSFGRYIDFISGLLKFPVGLACWLFFFTQQIYIYGPYEIYWKVL